MRHVRLLSRIQSTSWRIRNRRNRMWRSHVIAKHGIDWNCNSEKSGGVTFPETRCIRFVGHKKYQDLWANFNWGEMCCWHLWQGRRVWLHKCAFVRRSRFVSCVCTHFHMFAYLFVHICLHFTTRSWATSELRSSLRGNFMTRVHIPEVMRVTWVVWDEKLCVHIHCHTSSRLYDNVCVHVTVRNNSMFTYPHDAHDTPFRTGTLREYISYEIFW